MKICASTAVRERCAQVCYLVILSINWVALKSEFDLAASLDIIGFYPIFGTPPHPLFVCIFSLNRSLT